MQKKNEPESRATYPPAAESVSVSDIAPYLRALQLARADLLSGQIRGERAPSAVDNAVDTLLDEFYGQRLPVNQGRVIDL